MARMIVALLAACVDPEGGAPTLEPTLTVHAESGTFAVVTWTTDEPTDGRLEYGADDTYGATLVATDSEDGTNHTVRWFGTPAGETVHWRVVSEGGSPLTSADQTFEAPRPPAAAPSFSGTVGEGATSGYVLTSLVPGPVGAVLLDPQNRPVWWHSVEDGRYAMQARLSADGAAVLLLETSEDYFDGEARLSRLPLDGTAGWTLPLPAGHHDVRELDDGRFLYLAVATEELSGATVAGDSLVAIDEAGATETMWSTWGTVPPDTIEPKLLYEGNFVDWTHCNSFDLDPATGEYWVSAHNLSSILVVDPQIHGVRWQIGGPRSNVTLEGGGFDQQHSPLLVPGGFLVFDNGPVEAEAPESEVVEFGFDPASATATRTWAYEDPDGLFAAIFGNAARLADGNTFVGWGSAGRAAEVTPTGQEVRRIEVGLGTAFGFAHPLGLDFTAP